LASPENKMFSFPSIGTGSRPQMRLIAFGNRKISSNCRPRHIARLADGVGGEANGESASRLAAETALEIFKEANRKPPMIVRRIFDGSAARIFQARPKAGPHVHHLLPPFFATTRSPLRTSAIHAPNLTARKDQADDHRPFLHSYRSNWICCWNVMPKTSRTLHAGRARRLGPVCHYDIKTESGAEILIWHCSDGTLWFRFGHEILDIVRQTSSRRSVQTTD